MRQRFLVARFAVLAVDIGLAGFGFAVGARSSEIAAASAAASTASSTLSASRLVGRGRHFAAQRRVWRRTLAADIRGDELSGGVVAERGVTRLGSERDFGAIRPRLWSRLDLRAYGGEAPPPGAQGD